MPGMTRAVKLQDKAARVGFDWPNLGPVLDKVREELTELEVEINAGDQAKINDEFGDLLFVMANVARHLKVDPEAALRSANAKFTRRFAHIEQALAALDRTPAQSNLEEMDALWDQAKQLEKRD
jgi:nucleoside triphosphate diphosphatase